MSYTREQRHYNKVIKPVLDELNIVAKKAAGYKQKGQRINVKRMSSEQIAKLILTKMLEG